MKKIWIVVLWSFTVLYAGKIQIAVASNMGDAIVPLKEAFEEMYPQTQVEVILGSSGKLIAQIKNGAPYDLFMSADMKYPQALYEEGIATFSPVVYAQGGLAYLSMKQRNFSVGVKLLIVPEIEKIAIANPKTAPYGVAAEEALKKGGVYEPIQKKLVYGESISQTLTYALRAADIGIVAKSSLFSPSMRHFKEGVHWSEVDEKLYAPIDQGMVIVKKSTTMNPEVEAFYAFVLSPKAQEVLKAFGYKVP
jgi:molybdate transport system substrate-binding protein